MRVSLDAGARKPERAHPDDAGLDLFSREAVRIPARGSAVIDTGVHTEIAEGCCGILISKSGLNIKHGILSTGLIDSSYRGSIRAKLYNNTDEDYIVEVGDKITQLVILPCELVDVEVVGELSETERGNGGFGSTGR